MYNDYPNIDDLADLTPSELDPELLAFVKRNVILQHPNVFLISRKFHRYEDSWPINEITKSVHRNRHRSHINKS